MEEEFPKLGFFPLRKPGVLFTGGSDSYSNGAIGCLLSHLDVMQAAFHLKNNFFVWEDDVHLKDNSLEVLNECSEDLTNIEWDLFYAGGNVLKKITQVTNNLGRLLHCQSTVSFGVRWEFIPTLLNYFDLQNILEPIDVTLANRVIPNHNAFISIPMVSTQRSDFSDIEGKNVQYEDYLEKRYWENLR
jgi:GR25 family glycosyltransferase involved in LPS biosynthesis